MAATTERAILAGVASGECSSWCCACPVSSRRGSAIRAAMSRTPRTATTERTRKRSRSRSTQVRRASATCWSSSSRSTTRRRPTAGKRPGRKLQVGIFYTSEQQRHVPEDTIADVEGSGLSPGKVVIELSPAGDFSEAEPEHQDYLERYPNGYTCHFVRPQWKLPRRNAARRRKLLSSVECNVRLRASYRGCIRPYPLSISSLRATHYKISPAQRKYLS